MPEQSALANAGSYGYIEGEQLTAITRAREPSFCEGTFCDILDRLLDAGYAFLRFDFGEHLLKEGLQEPICFLRQDVDISPKNALRMGILAARKGVTANYFFQLNAETYNIFGDHTRQIIGELRRLGHCVGLHIDESFLGCEEETIARTVDWFSTCCVSIDRVVSFHRPSRRVLGRQYAAFVSSYAPTMFHSDRYASDSRRSMGFIDKVERWIAEQTSPVQLVLHPDWWLPHSSPEAIWDELSARREWELAKYLDENFRTVFEHVKTPKHDVFRV